MRLLIARSAREPEQRSLFLLARILVEVVETHRVPHIVPSKVDRVGLDPGHDREIGLGLLTRRDALRVHADRIGIARADNTRGLLSVDRLSDDQYDGERYQ